MARRKKVDPIAILEIATTDIRDSYGHDAAFDPVTGILGIRGIIGHFGFRLCDGDCDDEVHLHIFYFARGSVPPPDGDEPVGIMSVEADGVVMAGMILMKIAGFFLVDLDENPHEIVNRYRDLVHIFTAGRFFDIPDPRAEVPSTEQDRSP